MRIFTWVVAVFILLVIQSGVLTPLHIMPVNLVLVLLILALLADSLYTATTIGIAGGLMLDFMSSSGDGMITLAFLSTLVIMYFLLEVFLNRELSPMIFAISVATGTWIYALSLATVNWIYNWFHHGIYINWKHFTLDNFLWVLLFNLLFTYPVWLYLSLGERLILRTTKTKHG